MQDYMELAIQFAVVSMFSALFPMAPAICFVINLLELRSDAIKLCLNVRMPTPARTDTIAPWLSILRVLAWMSVAVNAVWLCLYNGAVRQWLLPGGGPGRGPLHLLYRTLLALHRADPHRMGRASVAAADTDGPLLLRVAVLVSTIAFLVLVGRNMALHYIHPVPKWVRVAIRKVHARPSTPRSPPVAVGRARGPEALSDTGADRQSHRQPTARQGGGECLRAAPENASRRGSVM